MCTAGMQSNNVSNMTILITKILTKYHTIQIKRIKLLNLNVIKPNHHISKRSKRLTSSLQVDTHEII